LAKAFYSRWGHHGLCTTRHQPTNRSRSFEFIPSAGFISHGDERKAISIEELAENLSCLIDLTVQDGLPRFSEMVSKFPLKLIVVGLIQFLSCIEFLQ